MLVWDKTLEDVANPSSYAVYIVGGRFRDYELFNRLAVLRTNIQTAASGVKVALVLRLAFVFHAFLIHQAFTLIPFEATIYEAGIELINMAISGIFLVVWRWR
jgi:hypothetical protein